MVMYTFKSANIWSTKFDVISGQDVLGNIAYSTFMSSANIRIGEDEVVVASKKWYSTKKIITQNGEQTGSASFKMMSFKPRIEIEYRGHMFVLRATDMWQRHYDVYLSDKNTPIGSINKRGIFFNAYDADFPESVELWFQAVMVTLLITLATYQSAAAS